MKFVRNKLFSCILSIMLVCTLALGIDIPQQNSFTAEAATYESAWFPMSVMNLTQLAYESYSHSNSPHIDCIGSTYAFAPFTGKIVNASSNYGVTLFQSTNKVRFADGSLDYMTVMFMHGTPLYSTGTTIKQGTNMYKLGGLGANGVNAYGTHLDIGVYKGQTSSFGSYYSRFGNTYPFDAFYINTSKTSVVNKGKMESGNTMYNNAPSNYSNLWRTLGSSGDGGTTSGIDVTYQVYDSSKGAFLPNVVNTSDYAGIYGHSITAVYASLSRGNITYRVHVKGGSWLPAVTNRSDYAGITSKPIDGLMMTTDTGKTIHYRVHIKGGSWLPYVTGYSTSDSNNGYAGNLGQEVDAIQIYLS